jgi:hypothetical protein
MNGTHLRPVAVIFLASFFVEEAPSRNGSGNQGKGYKSSKAEVKGCSASG